MFQALEEVEKNFSVMRFMLSGDGEVEPNAEQVSQLAEEICKEDVISLLIHKLSLLGWEVSNDKVVLFNKTKRKKKCQHSVYEYELPNSKRMTLWCL